MDAVLEKRCTTCKLEKSIENFEMQPSKGRRRAECRGCRTIAQRERRANRKLNPPSLKYETKRCNHCHEVKSIDDFSPADLGYFHGKCKACERDIDQKKRQEQYRNDPAGKFFRPFVNEAGIRVKRCVDCHKEKPLSEFYANGKGRYHSKCNTCEKAIKKTEYDANPEKYRAAALESARKHPERTRARFKRWYTTHTEHLTRYRKERHVVHREKFLAVDRIRHIKNAEQERLYRIAHRAEAAERAQRRRALQRNAPRVEKIKRLSIIERDKWTCYLCGQICTTTTVSLDHVVPLFRGGSHTADNLRVACRSCNSRKGAKLLHEFLK